MLFLLVICNFWDLIKKISTINRVSYKKVLRKVSVFCVSNLCLLLVYNDVCVFLFVLCLSFTFVAIQTLQSSISVSFLVEKRVHELLL